MLPLTLYNRISIFIFTVLLTPLGGALMFGYNLRAVEKRKMVTPLVIGALVVTAIIRAFVNKLLPDPFYGLFIPNIAAGLLLVFPVWDHHLSEYPSFNSKGVAVPLIVSIVLWSGMALLIFFR